MTDSSPMFRTKQPRVATVRQNPIYYKDLNANWTQDRKPLVVTETDALLQKLESVLTVLVGEEHHEPTFGTELPWLLFEGLTPRTVYRMEGATIRAVGEFMSTEISLLHSECLIEPLEEEDAVNVVIAGQDILGNPVEWQRTLRRADFGY